MPEPICRAQSEVSPQQLERIQSQAREFFTEARPILDAELLNKQEWSQRAQKIRETLGVSMDADGMARRIMNRMDTREMPQFRTHTNVYRLVKSRRISEDQLVEWLKLSLKDADLDLFRDRSKQIFLGAKLFFYEFIPHQGTAWCYMPTNK